MIEKLLALKPNDGRFVYLIKTLISRFNEHNISRIGAQLAYFMLLSLFPFLIFLNALIGSFHISTSEVVEFLDPFFPEQIVSLISTYIAHISNNQSISVLSIGIIVTIFSASKSVRSLSYAINTAYGIHENKNPFFGIFLSMVFVIATGVVILIVTMFITLSRDFLMQIIKVNQISDMLVGALGIWRWVTLSVILFFILAMMYKLVPNKKIRFLSVIPGTIFAIAAFIGLTVGFSIYVNYFIRNSALYGTIGAVILLVLWMYLVSIILVLGAEINSAIEIMPRKFKK